MSGEVEVVGHFLLHCTEFSRGQSIAGSTSSRIEGAGECLEEFETVDT